MAVTTPYAYASALLSACESLLASTVGGAIDRAYVAHTAPAHDCEMLVVVLGALTVRSLSPNAAARLGYVPVLTYQVHIIRDCFPVTGADGRSAPTPAQHSAAAQETSEDLWAVFHGIPGSFPADHPCAGLTIDGAVPVAVSGQMGGWLISVRAETPGN